MPDPVATYILDLSWSVALVPVGGNQDPTVGTDLRQERVVGDSEITRDVFLINAIADPCLVQFGRDLWAVPVFVEVESVVTLPLR